MDIPAEARALEARIKDAGLRIQPILEEAEVARSTWTRWKAGSFKPRLDTWNKVNAAAKRRLNFEAVSA